MLARIRTIFAHSWVARIVAVILAASFGAWGIGGALSNLGTGADNVARVGDISVTAPEFDRAYQHELQQAADEMARAGTTPADPTAIPAPMRREIGQDVLRRLVSQAVLVREAGRIGLVVPDAVLRQTVFDIPQFKGPNGQFDRRKFDTVLQSNGLTEQRILSLLRDELLSRGLIEPVRAGVVAPTAMARALFGYAAETRTVALVRVPAAAQKDPPTPDDAVLRRFYLNHPKLFEAPERRRIRAVVLSPETVSRDVKVPDADIRALYARERFRLERPARRSVDVVTAPTEATARAIAAFWQGGAQWKQVEALATQDGATAITVPNTAARELPSESLARAVFAATPGQVSDAAKVDAGWAVLEVTGETAGSGDYASVHDQLRTEIAEARVASGLSERVDRLQDAIAGGGLDKIPADIGAVAVAGSLDAQGRTEAGDPAPIPGSPAFRQAVITQAFAAKKGAAPNLQPGPGHGYAAVEVDEIIPARERDFDEALPDIVRLWHLDALRHEAEAKAASIYATAKANHALPGAAAAAGLPVEMPPPFRRSGSANGVPPPVVQVAFALNRGDATMVEDRPTSADGKVSDGFVVAVLLDVTHPDPASDQAALGRLRAQVRQTVADDLEISTASWLTAQARPQLNADAINRVIER